MPTAAGPKRADTLTVSLPKCASQRLSAGTGAVVSKEPYQVAVEDVDDARIEDPTDALVRITTTAICGSDLHMYEGRTAAPAGLVFGHENMGIVEEVGPGDRLDQAGRSGVHAVQRRLRVLQELPGRIHPLLPHREPGIRRRGLRLRFHGPLPRRSGGVPAGALRRLRLPAPADCSAADPIETIREQTGGDGTDKGIDAVGYQATVGEGEEQPAIVLGQLIETVRATGTIGVVGLYVTGDTGAASEEAKRDELLVKIGKLFERGRRSGTGQANVKAYNQHLRDLIVAGRAEPSFVVSKKLPLPDAPDGRFDKREEGYSKVALKPGASTAA